MLSIAMSDFKLYGRATNWLYKARVYQDEGISKLHMTAADFKTGTWETYVPLDSLAESIYDVSLDAAQLLSLLKPELQAGHVEVSSSEEDTYMTVQTDFEGTHLVIRIPEEGSSMSSLGGAAKAKADSEFVLAMFDQFKQSEDTKDARISEQAARIAELEGKEAEWEKERKRLNDRLARGSLSPVSPAKSPGGIVKRVREDNKGEEEEREIAQDAGKPKVISARGRGRGSVQRRGFKGL